MANKTIYPFGTGGQLPSSIGIINDLVTGGANVALSAEQGKVLKGMVDGIEMPIVDEHDNNTILAAPSARQMKLAYTHINTLKTKVDDLIDDLANIAFVGLKTAKIGTLDWTGGKTKFILTMFLTGCTASITTGDASKGKVYEGNVVIRLTPSTHYIMSTVTLKDGSNNDVTFTSADNLNGTVDISFTAASAVTLAATATEDVHATVSLSASSTNVEGRHDGKGDALTFPLKIYADMLVKDEYRIEFTPTSGNSFTTFPSVGGATLSNNELVVTNTNVTNGASIEVTAVAGIQYTISNSGLGSGVTTSNNASTIANGASYYTKLGTSNNLYVVDDSSVQVTMGGTDITSQVYSNDEITIPSVTGNVVITANAQTYITNGLVMHLDGKNRGGVTGKWTSLVNYNNGNGFNAPIEFNLTDCTEYDDHVYFNGTSSKGTLPSGFGISTLELLAYSSTIEFYYDESELVDNMMCIMYNGSGSLIEFSVFRTTSGTTANESGYVWATCCTGGAPADGTPQATAQANASTQMYPSYLAAGGHFSCSCGIIIYNGYTNSGYNKAVQSANASTNPKLALMYKDRTTSNACTKGNLYFVRVYNRGLTTQERAYNRAIDQKRFGVTFTYPPSVD